MANQLSTSGDFRVSWLPIVVAALGFAATLETWHTLRSHERQELRWATKLTADAIRTNLTADMEWQLFGLDRLALLWEEAADKTSSLWTKNAELYIQHRPGCIAVERITADGAKHPAETVRNRESTVRFLAFDGVPRSLIEAAADAKVPLFSPPVSVPGGGKQYAIAYPVYAKGRLQGSVVSFFDLDRSLGYILDDIRPFGFSVELSQGGQRLYLLPGSDRGHEREWTASTELPIPGGAWQVRVWPNPGILNQVVSRSPYVALALGSLLSLLLATAVHLLTLTSRHSAHVRDVNEQLRTEAIARSQAQGELARAHAELEARIQERTVDLATTNALLEREIEGHEWAEAALREITGRLFRLQDEERRRLARELHDGATQGLVALAMNVQSLRESAADASTSQTLDESSKLIEQCTSELRTISYLLHPPYFDELGLGPALRSYVAGFAARSGIRTRLEMEPDPGRLGHDVELAIFRVVQEALANVHHHSRSRTATIVLVRDSGEIRLEIADDGQGMHPEILARVHAGVAGVGTAGMLERVRYFGGRLEITSGETGTRIRASLQLSKATLA